MDPNNLTRGTYPLTTTKFQVEVPMDFAIMAVRHSHYTNLVATKYWAPYTPGSSEFNRGLNVKFQGKGKFVVEHVK